VYTTPDASKTENLFRIDKIYTIMLLTLTAATRIAGVKVYQSRDQNLKTHAVTLLAEHGESIVSTFKEIKALIIK